MLEVVEAQGQEAEEVGAVDLAVMPSKIVSSRLRNRCSRLILTTFR